MIGLEVHWPLGAVLGGPKGLCGWSWAALRASVVGPGSLSEPLRVPPCRSQGLCGRSWAVFGSLRVVLGRLGSACRCWAAPAAYVRGLGPHVGGLGPLLRPMLAVLAALGASVGGPEPSWAEKNQST